MAKGTGPGTALDGGDFLVGAALDLGWLRLELDGDAEIELEGGCGECDIRTGKVVKCSLAGLFDAPAAAIASATDFEVDRIRGWRAAAARGSEPGPNDGWNPLCDAVLLGVLKDPPRGHAEGGWHAGGWHDGGVPRSGIPAAGCGAVVVDAVMIGSSDRLGGRGCDGGHGLGGCGRVCRGCGGRGPGGGSGRRQRNGGGGGGGLGTGGHGAASLVAGERQRGWRRRVWRRQGRRPEVELQ